MSNAIVVGLAIYCTIANLFGFLTLSSAPIYARDAIIATAIIIASFKISKLKAAIISCTSAIIVLSCFAKGFSPELIPKIRNYSAFPYLCLIVTYSSEIARDNHNKSNPDNANSWVYLIFTIITIGTIIESIIYIISPEIQAVAWSTLTALSEEKGVSVGLGGGLLNGTRAMTPLLSPVQGSFVAFTCLAYMINTKRSTIFFYAIHLFTLSKITIIGDLLLKATSNITPSRLTAVILAFSSLIWLFAAFASPESIEINIESMKLHFSGAGYGLLAPIDFPIGLELDKVGALSLNDGNPLTPGFESFLGSISASFGWPGLLLIAISALYFGSKSKLMIVIFLMWLLSDNVSSPHLFVIPIFWVLLNKEIIANTKTS